MNIIGQAFTIPQFKEYLSKLKDWKWSPKGVTLHHTAAPSLAQRPSGFLAQHMRNLAHYYGNELGWKAGPHLFVDEDQIWVFSPLTSPGTHAKSFNGTHIGIEVLGDYDSEDPTSGRGLKCWQMAMQATKEILDNRSLKSSSWNFHRDDPKTSKTCPGKRVTKEFLSGLLSPPQ